MIKIRPWLKVLCIALLFNAPIAFSATNDVYPGDYFPADPGYRSLTLYLYDRNLVGPYDSGDKLANAEI